VHKTNKIQYEVETRTEQEMIEGVRERMLDAVRTRLRADVPVGIYLSGGIDSSVIAGMVTHLIKEEGIKVGSKDPKERVCCFSIAFDEESGFDESSKLSDSRRRSPLTSSKRSQIALPTGSMLST
jgi:asparagine synthase (glutamine-hydrolysing)